MSIPVNIVFEDVISGFMMKTLLNSFGNKFYIGKSFQGYGFGYIKSKINGFNQAAIATPFFVLTDLDKYECPPQLINDWLHGFANNNLIFRIAIKEAEAWLLADIEGFSDYLDVSPVNFPENPESEPDPKQTLIRLVKKSKKRKIKEDIIPINDKACIGPNYNERLIDFVVQSWDVKRAMSRSESLRRAYVCLEKYTYTAPN